jgi:multidrug resistance protein romA
LQDGAIAWFGHSTVLFQTSGKRFLLDPVFYRASPLPFSGNPFAQKQPTLPADFPPLDAVLISHDHYDHLDYRTIQELKDKTGHFYVLWASKRICNVGAL